MHTQLNSATSKGASRRRSLAFLMPHRRAIAGALALSFAISALGAIEPLVTKGIFDAIGRAGALRLLAISVGGLLLLEIVRAAAGAFATILQWDVRLAVDQQLRTRLVARLSALPLSYHQKNSVGGTMQKFNQASTGYIDALAQLGFTLLPTAAYLVVSLVIMWRLDWRLSLLVLAFTPLPAIISGWAAREQTERERTLMEVWTALYSRLNEVLAGIQTVKGFGMERAEQERFSEGQRAGNEIVKRGVRTDARTEAVRGFAATLARLAAIGFGGYLVARGTITIGTLVAFLGYVAGLFGPVQGLTGLYQTLRKATVSREIIDGILDAPDVLADTPQARDIPRVSGAVEFDDVRFAYQADQPNVLAGVSFGVRPGETVAIVGPSGSGKSTLLSLLQRLHPIGSGSIRIDGTDIRDMTLRSLRTDVGVVYQDSHVFADTVRANIAYGSPNATDEQVEAAARAANAHDFIMALPHGYATTLGERGAGLSGGQRQRIAIARALLRNPPILLLDEPTSALDAESEHMVQQALRSLMVDRTTIVVAHRLSTIMDADRIIVLRDGIVTASGTHDALMSECPYYARLVRTQQFGLLSEAA